MPDPTSSASFRNAEMPQTPTLGPRSSDENPPLEATGNLDHEWKHIIQPLLSPVTHQLSWKVVSESVPSSLWKGLCRDCPVGAFWPVLGGQPRMVNTEWNMLEPCVHIPQTISTLEGRLDFLLFASLKK